MMCSSASLRSISIGRFASNHTVIDRKNPSQGWKERPSYSLNKITGASSSRERRAPIASGEPASPSSQI